MPPPVAPTITEIVTEALKRAGRTSPTATQISDATTHQLREVKADIMLAAPTHPYLQATAYTHTVRGQWRYPLPPDSNVPVSVALLWGPEESGFQGTATAGAASTITLAASLSQDEATLLGRQILITGGTGESQVRVCIGWDNTTKVWTCDTAWDVVPSATSTYQILFNSRSLWYPKDTATEFDRMEAPYTLSYPEGCSIFGDDFLLFPIPDHSRYGLRFRYFLDLDQIDTTGSVFLNLLREWRSLWIQGIAVKCMQRYDEDRYQTELSVYNAMLTALASKTSRVSVGRFFDV